MSDILYRPNLDYEKSYSTKGTFEQAEAITTDTQETSPQDGLGDILDKLIQVESVLSALPYDIAKALSNVIRCAEYIYEQIDPNNYDPDYVNSDVKTVITPSEDEKTQAPSSDENTDNADDEGPDGIFSDTIPLMNVEINRKDPVQAIQEEYDNTLASILKDYLDKIQVSFNKYFSNIIASAAEIDTSNLAAINSTYEIKTTDIQNKNLHHASDMIIRSQIVRDQKLRLFRKLFNLNETISHVRACKVAKELKIRYYEEKKVSNDEYLDLVSNVMLTDSRKIYDKKYKENLRNLYKYLNSSVILIDECLMMFVQEAQAKMILMKEEGIKL